MENPTVVLTRCADYNAEAIRNCLEKQFSLQGGLEKFIKQGDSVLLKPNFIAPKPRECATQTDPNVIIETARLLKDFGAKPFVGDSPAWSNAFACAKALKLDEPLKKLGVPIKQLNKPKKTILGDNDIRVGISSVALEADAIIKSSQIQITSAIGCNVRDKKHVRLCQRKKESYPAFYERREYV